MTKIEAASAFKKAELPIIFAHDENDKTTDKYILANFKCANTGLMVIANNMPYVKSPFTGENMTPVNKKTSHIMASEIDSFAKVGCCPNCQSTLRMELNSALELSGHEINCTVCGTKVTAKVEIAEDLTSFDLSGEDEVTEDTGFEDVVPTEVENDGSDYTGEDVADDTVVEELPTEDLSTDDTVDTSLAEESLSIDDLPETDNSASAFENTDDLSLASVKETKAKSFTVANIMTSKSKDEKNTKPFQLTELASDLENADYDFVTSSNGTTYLMLENAPVATVEISNITNSALKTKAEKSFDLYRKAFTAVASKKITTDLLSEYGIKPIVVNVPFSTVEKAYTQQNESELFEKFKQSLAIAAAGYNKNAFATENPIFSAIYTELSAIGFGNPDEVIRRISTRVGNKYAKVVLEKAFEIAGKSEDSRNDYSELIETAAYQNLKSADTNLANEDDSVASKYADKLAKASMKISATAPVYEEKASKKENTNLSGNKFRTLFP